MCLFVVSRLTIEGVSRQEAGADMTTSLIHIQTRILEAHVLVSLAIHDPGVHPGRGPGCGERGARSVFGLRGDIGAGFA